MPYAHTRYVPHNHHSSQLGYSSAAKRMLTTSTAANGIVLTAVVNTSLLVVSTARRPATLFSFPRGTQSWNARKTTTITWAMSSAYCIGCSNSACVGLMTDNLASDG